MNDRGRLKGVVATLFGEVRRRERAEFVVDDGEQKLDRLGVTVGGAAEQRCERSGAGLSARLGVHGAPCFGWSIPIGDSGVMVGDEKLRAGGPKGAEHLVQILQIHDAVTVGVRALVGGAETREHGVQVREVG